MPRSLHSPLAAMLREAHRAATESVATGIPIDEVSAMRAERASTARRASLEARISRPHEGENGTRRGPSDPGQQPFDDSRPVDRQGQCLAHPRLGEQRPGGVPGNEGVGEIGHPDDAQAR